MQEEIRQQLIEGVELRQQVARTLGPDIEAAARMIIHALRRQGTVALCGNGGSAADAQHLAGELVGRFELDRPAYGAIALTTDTSILTAIGNDFGFDEVFARQVEGLLRPGDVLIVATTSGNSPNCIKAVEAARDRGVTSIGMTGQGGGRLAQLCDLCLSVPHTVTARVQEIHITIGHIICGLVEKALVSDMESANDA